MPNTHIQEIISKLDAELLSVAERVYPIVAGVATNKHLSVVSKYIALSRVVKDLEDTLKDARAQITQHDILTLLKDKTTTELGTLSIVAGKGKAVVNKDVVINIIGVDRFIKIAECTKTALTKECSKVEMYEVLSKGGVTEIPGAPSIRVTAPEKSAIGA